MIMSGVNGTYQYTGIQSRRSFAPPLILEATVRATTSHGNAFELRLVNADSSQGIVLNLNLGGDSGVWLGHTTDGLKLGDAQRTLVTPEASLAKWYTVRYAIDGSGAGTVVMDDSQGAQLASQTGLHVGAGPFFLVLAQWEGAPYSSGKNEAIWGHIELSSPSGASSAVGELAPPPSRAHTSGAEPPGFTTANPPQAPAVWLGFANGTGRKDREAELRRRCGDFRRVDVPLEWGNSPIEVCRREGKTCGGICDWEGRMFPCNAMSRGPLRDATRVALCR